MNFSVRIPLNTTPEQHERLLALQVAFAQVCNELAPLVQQTRVWNRVALHHMAYKALRERFPALGSQMVCNAIYSVSRACRLVFQTPGSPVHLSRLGERPLPRLHFTDGCPVYFDRHTLSLKDGQVSMYTLDGRMRFQLALRPQDEQAFHSRKLLEIVLQRAGERFELSFVFAPELVGVAAVTAPPPGQALDAPAPDVDPAAADEMRDQPAPVSPPPAFIPDYVRVEETA